MTKITTSVAEGTLPKKRSMSQRQISRVQSYNRKKRNLADCQFEALDLICKRRPESVISNRALTVKGGVAKLAYSFATRHTKRLLIHHGSALYMDSSWRNKAKCRAPLTFLTVKVEEAKHDISTWRMNPGAVLISSDATEETYTNFLLDTKKAIENEARIWSTEGGAPPEVAEILRNGWSPNVVMIDKCDAELAALRKVFPRCLVRLCQFHLVQALRRAYLKNEKELVLPVRESIMHAFIIIQRATSEQDLEKKLGDFFESMKALVSAKCFDALKNYFEVHWLCPAWRSTWTDFHLVDAGFHRSMGLNTNNFVESAFKTFDSVFLGGRANHRIDRLASIIICHFFPYYEFGVFDANGRTSQDTLETMGAGFKLFETKKEAFDVKESLILVPSAVKSDVYEVDISRGSCTCPRFATSGHLCKHYFAACDFLSDPSGSAKFSEGNPAPLAIFSPWIHSSGRPPRIKPLYQRSKELSFGKKRAGSRLDMLLRWARRSNP